MIIELMQTNSVLWCQYHSHSSSRYRNIVQSHIITKREVQYRNIWECEKDHIQKLNILLYVLLGIVKFIKLVRIDTILDFGQKTKSDYA